MDDNILSLADTITIIDLGFGAQTCGYSVLSNGKPENEDNTCIIYGIYN